MYADDINVANVINKLREPQTLALRLHGSRRVQNMLKSVQADHKDEMHVLKSVFNCPVVVLTTGDEQNTRKCAEYILEEWHNALLRVNFADQHVNERWFVSNHKFAVAMRSPAGDEVQQQDLPAGCEG